MNRKERRKAGKTEKVKTYVLTDQQIKKIKDDAVTEALKILLAVPVVVLHDKFGFGTVRNGRFLSCVNTWVKACMQDENTLAEVLKVAQEEAGYTLEIK